MNAYEQEIIQATLHSQGELINKQANRIAELEKENVKLTKDVHNLLFALNKESKVTGGGK